MLGAMEANPRAVRNLWLLSRRIFLEHFHHGIFDLLLVAALRIGNAVDGRLPAPDQLLLIHVVEVDGHDAHGARLGGSRGHVRKSSGDAPTAPATPPAPRTAAPAPTAESVSVGGSRRIDHFLGGQMVGDVNIGLRTGR